MANWCEQIGLSEEEKGRVGILVDKLILTMVEPEEVQLLVSLPTQAPGNRMQGGASCSQILEKNVLLTQLCEKAFFQHLVIAGNYYKIRPDEDDGWAQILPLPRNIRVLDLVRKPKRHNYWTSSGSSFCGSS